jgi:hypothetical protein
MDLASYLYPQRKRCKQKKPTEEYCETCRTKPQVVKPAPSKSNAVQSQKSLRSSASASGSSPAPAPVTNDDPQALSSKEGKIEPLPHQPEQVKQHTGNKKPQNNTATPLQGSLLHYLFPVLRQAPVKPGQPRQTPSPLIKKPAPQQDNHHKGSASPPARKTADPGTQQKQQEVRPQKKQVGISQVFLGRNTHTKKDITITETERTSGMHVLGGTGTGKSTLATGVFFGDIVNGHGGVFFDVEGDSITDLLPHIPQERLQDVLLLDLVELAKQGRFIGINPLAGNDIPSDVDRAVQIFKMLWEIGPETPRLENTLRQCLLTLAYNGLTIAEIKSLLQDAAFRKQCVDRLPHTYVWNKVRGYWEDDYNKLPLHFQRERADTILNKVDQLDSIPYTSYAITQDTTTVPFRELMDQNKIVLLRMSREMLGKDTVRFLGTFLMSELKNALFSRADVTKQERTFFSLVADEWQLYITPDFDDLLTRGRKYGCGAMVLNQTLFQLSRELQAITEQLNIHVTFRVGVNDAERQATLYYRDPQPEMREQEKKTPVSTPFDRLVSGHTHTNEVVNRFVDTHLRKIHLTLTSTFGKFGKQIEEVELH